MFFLTYLGRELRRRMRQAVFIAIGLAIGIGLVITVIGASSGVKAAQAKVLRALYGIGTDVTVTTKPKPPSGQPAGGQGTSGQATSGGPGGAGPRAEICLNGKCYTSGTVDTLVPGNVGALSQSEVAQIARLHDVSAAAGGLVLTDNRVTLPSASNPNIQPPTSFTVDGTDITVPRLGPLSNARLTSGRAFTAADEHSDVALADASYAASHNIKPGSTTTIGGTKFTVIGLVSQPQASSPPNIYIPLARAQALATDPGTGKSMSGKIDTVYVTAASASDIATVQQEIQHLLPQATVTSSSDLASEITGSAASAAKLAGALGTWLAVLVLIAAFAVASLLTMAAVARRVPEFGTLKALGWRSSRIVTQVLGESVTTGIVGGLAGVGLGFAGVAIIDKIAPKLSATVPSASGAFGTPQTVTGPGGAASGALIGGPATGHTTVAVPMSASVTIGAIALAVVLAIAGGLLAGSFGGWRAARLRPAAALARVA
ncbi:MAG TPA: ABC transporter permease [Streptosporangiaceae bacterium]|nr:ABC transporter permease [Streptosporangiaceae bacterium]